MRKLLAILKKQLQSGEDAVLVSVTASKGSVPRGAGARMVVTKEGRITGSIGGGPVEYWAMLRAQELMQTGTCGNQNYLLRKNEVADIGMVCGGEVEVHFQFLPAGDAKITELLERAEVCFAEQIPAWLICDVTDRGGLTLYDEEKGVTGMPLPADKEELLQRKPVVKALPEGIFFGEQIVRRSKVYIFGGGHVAQALAPVLTGVGFSCVVLESRAEFANPALFGEDVPAYLVDFTSRQQVYDKIGPDDYICVMTRGHKDDYEVQKQALLTPACYIGVIGSARKKEAVFNRLREDGFSEEDLLRIETPIGLAIKAETPAEIAISIAGRLIEKRASL